MATAMTDDSATPDEDQIWWDIQAAKYLFEAAHAAALREDWARTRVTAAGKAWHTHVAKFDGTVLPRENTHQ